MPWNQSNKDEQRDPWRGSGGQGPPDLDELLRKLTENIGRMFGLGRRGGRGGPADGGPSLKSGGAGTKSLGFILGIIVVVWLLTGIYIVSEGKRGVVLRFGAYERTSIPGPHWHIPFPIESVEKVDIDRVRSVQNKTQMLTKDENIVEVELAVQYNVKDAPDYLFNVRQPDTASFENPTEGTVFQVMESALREVVGKSQMDFLLGAGRAEIASQIKLLMQEILDGYKSGLEIITVNLQQSQPPPEVQDAFADAIKAREDEIRFVNEAEAYANGIIPKARGEAARMMEEAVAYREKVIANSEGEAQRFLKLYEEYSKAPQITRERLYLQAMESVLANSSKVMMDIEGGDSIFYLPLDKLLGTGRAPSAQAPDDASGDGKKGGRQASGDVGGRQRTGLRNSRAGRQVR